tara:strand:- start:100 stop:1203 length:1104 start_codon:yes stop_codon:yes gene_type:complete
MRLAYIVGAKRSIVSPINGPLSSLQIHELAAPVINNVVEASGIKSDEVDELIVSNALGAGGNPSRLIALASNLPERVGGLTIDRQCVGGLDAIMLAIKLVQSGSANVVVAGGVESFSNRPIRLAQEYDKILVPYDTPEFTPDSDQEIHMAEAAFNVAEKFGFTQKDQDSFAINSHANALNSKKYLTKEIVKIEPKNISFDPYARNLSIKLCERAPKLFGSITHANTAISADAASFVVVCKDLPKGRKALELVSGATIGADPRWPGIAPVAAIEKTLNYSGITKTDINHVEVMEAYASQAMACLLASGLSNTKTNPRGGALARGHPIGASGAILVTRLFSDLSPGELGIAAVAAAGGIGSAAIFRCLG